MGTFICKDFVSTKPPIIQYCVSSKPIFFSFTILCLRSITVPHLGMNSCGFDNSKMIKLDTVQLNYR